MDINRDPDSLAYAVQLGGLDIIGLQCVISGRKFLFPEGRQLNWLEDRLAAQGDAYNPALWRLILCHAPLLAHNPNRNDGQPYLDRNQSLQTLVDNAGDTVFLSGHTHVSPNVIKGCAEWDGARSNFYLNCGSVVATDTEGEEGLMAPDWKDGCITELLVFPDAVEACMRSIGGGLCFPRGYYYFADGACSNEKTA